MKTTLSVDIRLDGIEINGRLYTYPILLTELDALFDEEVEKYDRSKTEGFWAWFESRVTAKHNDGVHALSVKFLVEDGAHQVRIEGRPFDAEFGSTGPTYPNRDFGNGYILARRTEPGPDQHVKEITVEQKVPRQAAKQKPAAAKPKAKPEPGPVVEAAEFADLNFKLLVLQSLMYETELLTPAFSLHDFVAEHSDREFDVDAEGHAPIPEVLAHFAALPVPRALLTEITELEQDGGNEIYMQIAPLWDGEDDVFDVADFADVDLLPKLRSMTLIGVDEATLDTLRTKGIDAELL
ncbi:hypothetical protein [Agrococcus sp. ARC_14]|uniref:DUF6892 domain-containing protein n=1 Tax=Agrococcus sp. ARC_14 TaxID=2919927 RepID=UPI001F06C727|nr:hypothetical protein [Agrococcus sp. ARC_14]MCH1882531.1 hypothetical protein [Agrococcus sp. ARC_14]